MNDADMKKLKEAAIGSGEKIEDSSLFMSLYTKNYKEDPLCALQLGIAVMLDKPIGLLVPHGVDLADNLKRLAKGIEYFHLDDSKSLEGASERLTDKLFADLKDD